MVAAQRATVLPGQDEDTFLVENIRALNVIANILKGSKAPDTTLFAVQCLYNMVSVNPRNVVFLLELGIHTDVLNILKIPAQDLAGENVDAVLFSGIHAYPLFASLVPFANPPFNPKTRRVSVKLIKLHSILSFVLLIEYRGPLR